MSPAFHLDTLLSRATLYQVKNSTVKEKRSVYAAFSDINYLLTVIKQALAWHTEVNYLTNWMKCKSNAEARLSRFDA